MVETSRNGFELVFCPDKLQKVITFLERGYDWPNERSVKLFQYLKRQPSQFPTAAVYLDKGEIVIGILLFYQGYNKDQMKNVINFSNWYAKDKYRGIEAIRFAKSVTVALDKFIITCYTPMQAVSKVLKLIGYEDMHVRKTIIGLSNKFPFFQCKFPFTLLCFRRSLFKPINIEQTEKASDPPSWLYKVHKVKKLGISVSVLSLVNHGGKCKVDFFWLLMVVIRHRIVRINLYLKLNHKSASDVWLIKNSERELFLSPMDSELVI